MQLFRVNLARRAVGSVPPFLLHIPNAFRTCPRTRTLATPEDMTVEHSEGERHFPDHRLQGWVWLRLLVCKKKAPKVKMSPADIRWASNTEPSKSMNRRKDRSQQIKQSTYSTCIFPSVSNFWKPRKKLMQHFIFYILVMGNGLVLPSFFYLKKKIEEDTRRRKELPCIQTCRIDIVEIIIISKMIFILT